VHHSPFRQVSDLSIMVKRGNNQAAAAKCAKKAKMDPVLSSIADVINEAEDLPIRCRTMLVEVLPFTLSVPVDERHEIQSAAADMVEQTLHAKKAALEVAVSTEDAKLGQLKSSQVELTNASSEAAAAVATQKEVVQVAKCLLADRTTTMNASRAALTTLQAEQKTADAKLASAKEEKSALESAYENHFKPMKEDAAGLHFKDLEPFLKTIEMEQSLLIALPSTCGKSKETRGAFDNVVFDELEKAICAKIASLCESVATETPAEVERQTAVEAAQKDLDTKKGAQMEAVAEFEVAQKDQNEREATLVKAKQAVDEFQPQVDLLTASLDTAKAALEEFASGPMAGFKERNTAKATAAEAAPAGA